MNRKEIEENVNKIILKKFPTRRKDETSIEDFDSIDKFDIMMDIEDFFKIKIQDLEYENWTTITEIVDCVERLKNGKIAGNKELISNNDIVYISGPMTGYDNFNRDFLISVENLIRNNTEYKEIINPAYIPPEYTWEMAMEKDLDDVRSKATVMVLLPGWENSKGSRLEVLEALRKDIKIIQFYDLMNGIKK